MIVVHDNVKKHDTLQNNSRKTKSDIPVLMQTYWNTVIQVFE